MENRKIVFTESQDAELSATIDESDEGATKGAVLFAYCFTCSKNVRSVGHINSTASK